MTKMSRRIRRTNRIDHGVRDAAVQIEPVFVLFLVWFGLVYTTNFDNVNHRKKEVAKTETINSAWIRVRTLGTHR